MQNGRGTLREKEEIHRRFYDVIVGAAIGRPSSYIKPTLIGRGGYYPPVYLEDKYADNRIDIGR